MKQFLFMIPALLIMISCIFIKHNCNINTAKVSKEKLQNEESDVKNFIEFGVKTDTSPSYNLDSGEIETTPGDIGTRINF